MVHREIFGEVTLARRVLEDGELLGLGLGLGALLRALLLLDRLHHPGRQLLQVRVRVRVKGER